MKIIIIFPDDARLENTCQKNCKRWRMIRKYVQNLLSRVKRSECSRAMAAKITNLFERVDEPLPIRWQSHPVSLSAVREVLEKSNSQQISFFPNLHCQPFPPFGLCKLMTAPCEHPLYLTDISSWDGRSV